MKKHEYIILYVSNPVQSAQFYKSILKKEPVEASDTFAMFTLASGTLLGLWAKDDVMPSPIQEGEGGELCFLSKDLKDLQSTLETWKKKGINIIQNLEGTHFGTTFMGLDPDGHRLRVLLPNQG